MHRPASTGRRAQSGEHSPASTVRLGPAIGAQAGYANRPAVYLLLGTTSPRCVAKTLAKQCVSPPHLTEAKCLASSEPLRSDSPRPKLYAFQVVLEPQQSWCLADVSEPSRRQARLRHVRHVR